MPASGFDGIDSEQASNVAILARGSEALEAVSIVRIGQWRR